jgi:hypothetical protein
VELLYTSLLLQAGAQLVRQRPARPGESVAAYRRSWLHGFAVEVHRRLVAAEYRAESEAGFEGGSEAGSGAASSAAGPSVGLVLAERSARVERAYAQAFPVTGRARRSALSGSGYPAGAAAGERADLGRGAVAPLGRQALGA